MDFNFSGLVPDAIIDAIETLGIRISSGLLALNSYENRVYQYTTEEGVRHVVKFYRPGRWTSQQILEEHAFANELLTQDIPFVAPLCFHGSTLHHCAGTRFAIFPSVGGRQFEVDNDEQLEWMGRFIGRMHCVSKATEFAHRPVMSLQSYIDKPIEVLHDTRLIPAHLHLPFFTIIEQLQEKLHLQWSNAFNESAFIRLHGDCHPGNILWRDGPSFVDLDDCRMGPAIQDLWMMLSGDRQQRRYQIDTLIDAYEEFQSFDLAELALIEPLCTMRMIHYMAWLSVRWADPAFPQAFPWFSTDKYWEQQILSLKEQFSNLDEKPISLTIP